jgi:hypothetical protein
MVEEYIEVSMNMLVGRPTIIGPAKVPIANCKGVRFQQANLGITNSGI